MPRPALLRLAQPLFAVALAVASVAAAFAPSPSRGAPYDPTLGAPDAGPVVATEADRGPFDRDLGLGVYYSRWASTYDAGGVGFKLRWEPIDELGIEVFTELLSVDVPRGTRFDLPSGFSLYAPITLFEGLRIRPKIGLCTMFSFTTGEGLGDPGADDVKFGFHAGAGLELALGARWSLFADATYQGYFGHGQDDHGWSTALESTLQREDSLQIGLGVQLHL